MVEHSYEVNIHFETDHTELKEFVRKFDTKDIDASYIKNPETKSVLAAFRDLTREQYKQLKNFGKKNKLKLEINMRGPAGNTRKIYDFSQNY
jgi:hypothetical protein